LVIFSKFFNENAKNGALIAICRINVKKVGTEKGGALIAIWRINAVAR